MALIVENGTIVSGANTYVSDAEYVTYAAERGYTIGAFGGAREIELIKAMDFLESYRDRFKGSKVTKSQPLQWPRVSVFIDTFQENSNELPEELKKAQMELAYQSITLNLAPSGAFQNVQSQGLGALSVSYYNGGSYQSVQLKSVDLYLRVLLKNMNRNVALRA
tara:strand:+ start:21027 stop:21518 length:492 start_codon:yes stop_codon:yes gene_type:complete